MTNKQLEALDMLKNSMKNIHGYTQYKRWILQIITEKIELITLKNKKFIFNRKFYNLLIENIKLNHHQHYARRKEVKLENQLYKLCNALKKKDFIHKQSVYFPKSFVAQSINPNPMHLLTANFEMLDRYSMEMQKFMSNFQGYDLESMYIYLRLYHRKLFSKNILELLLIDDVLTFSKTQCVLVLYYKLFSKISSNNKIYKTVVLDSYIAEKFYIYIQSLNERREDRRVFINIEYYEDIFHKYRQSIEVISSNL
ncbi:MAG: hypothetical protein QM490_00545 [Candidatus Gracilibacteria bacterium]